MCEGIKQIKMSRHLSVKEIKRGLRDGSIKKVGNPGGYSVKDTYEHTSGSGKKTKFNW